jgi:hypothetical protein
MVGTPSYMAPEMSMGDPASFRSDVWALGVVMHEILFGRRPEWEVTAREQIFRSPLDKHASHVLHALANLCADCASESLTARPADAVEVARRFEQAARGDALAPAGRRWLHRAGWAALAAAVVLGVWTARRRSWPSAYGPGSAINPAGRRSLALGGTAVDVSAARRVATFDGRVHCAALLPGGRSLRVVVGEPRQAFDVDTVTGIRAASALRPETYAVGCPVLSSDGRELLFESVDQTGALEIVHSRRPNGEGGRVITKGANPEWIANTEDFAFDLDLTHAAVFSIPVMNSSLVADDVSGQRRLVEKAVSARGDLLVLRFLDDHGENLFIVHALPGLEALARFSLSGYARNLSFDRRTDLVQVSVDGPEGNAWLALVDWRAGMAHYQASLSEWDLRHALTDELDTTFFVSRRLAQDVWQYRSAGAAPIRLTADGSNDNVARSASGRLLIQKRRRNGSYVLALFEPGAPSPTFVTSGPSDVMPAFAEKGRDWFFVRSDRQAIVHCDAESSCRDIHVDPQQPAWPVPSPDGTAVAYLTWLNTPRLKLLSLRDRVSRTLVAAMVDCAPIWSDNGHLWVVQASERLREWTEIEVASGRGTGRRRPAGDGPVKPESCAWNDSPLAARYPQVRVLGRETSEIRAIRAQAWR